MHTDATLDIMSQATTSLGDSTRDFREKTCAKFQTRELERERAARQRRKEKNAAKCGAGSTPAAPSDGAEESTTTASHGTGPTSAGASSHDTGESTNAGKGLSIPTSASSGGGTRASANATNRSGPKPKAPSNSARKAKHLNLNTYTFHALGDYVATIRHFGTTDSYSTQPVSL
jgi:hypothetical protein